MIVQYLIVKLTFNELPLATNGNDEILRLLKFRKSQNLP